MSNSVSIIEININAPERRVIMIDVGNMSPQRAQEYLESIKKQFQDSCL